MGFWSASPLNVCDGVIAVDRIAQKIRNKTKTKPKMRQLKQATQAFMNRKARINHHLPGALDLPKQVRVAQQQQTRQGDGNNYREGGGGEE
jgi:hypothetical protein